MKQYQKLTLVLCGIWAATLLYGEMAAFWMPSFYSCTWPPPPPSNYPTTGGGDYVKVAVLTDPQLLDRTSLPLSPKSLALEIVQFFSDIYMRRAFYQSILPLKPDVILFLGDYFAGGAYLSDDDYSKLVRKNVAEGQETLATFGSQFFYLDKTRSQYQHESLHRFRHIFGRDEDRRHANIQAYTIPGNHDVGYASINYKPEVTKRYEKEFGNRNYQFTVGKVEFIAVDAQTLDGDPQGQLTSTSWEFVNNVSKADQVLPRVLLTHIPLYRRDYTFCGPQRSSPFINQNISISGNTKEILYQKFLTEESSKRLLDLIKPVLILSGHDHDQCTVIHQSKVNLVEEHTVGTINWQQGNLYPSFMLLSVSKSTQANFSTLEEAITTQLCFLPMQTHIYAWYLLLFGLTLIFLLGWPTSGINFGQQFSGLIACVKLCGSIFKGGKEKNEDEDCEYEMMWDAEGAMHLVKKPRDAPISRPSDRSSLERGNAVMRKNVSPGIEVSMSIDTSADAGYEASVKLPHRTYKSRTRMVMQRLLRTFGMVAVIASVNLPLYMMLLFKDWVDR